MVKDADRDQRLQLDARLWKPPKGQAAVQGPWTAEAETNAFNTLQAQITGKIGIEGSSAAPDMSPAAVRKMATKRAAPPGQSARRARAGPEQQPGAAQRRAPAGSVREAVERGRTASRPARRSR